MFAKLNGLCLPRSPLNFFRLCRFLACRCHCMRWLAIHNFFCFSCLFYIKLCFPHCLLSFWNLEILDWCCHLTSVMRDVQNFSKTIHFHFLELCWFQINFTKCHFNWRNEDFDVWIDNVDHWQCQSSTSSLLIDITGQHLHIYTAQLHHRFDLIGIDEPLFNLVISSQVHIYFSYSFPLILIDFYFWFSCSWRRMAGWLLPSLTEYCLSCLDLSAKDLIRPLT